MRDKMRIKLTLASLLLAAALPVLAHHSLGAEYDVKKPLTLTGTVDKIEFFNPHIWIYLDVKDANGQTARWQCEGAPPNNLIRQGWTKSSLKSGDTIKISGFQAKDGASTCAARTVTLPDGKKVFTGSAGDGGPQQ
jgi:Family of unknown function (DUF6152)